MPNISFLKTLTDAQLRSLQAELSYELFAREEAAGETHELDLEATL